MSHSKKRAHGQSYYFDAVNQRAAKYVWACAICGHRGFDAVAAEHEPNRHLVAELRHLYSPLQLNAAGQCSTCAAQVAQRSAGT
jgi:hypothetical protein